jgi:hypothetical protein
VWGSRQRMECDGLPPLCEEGVEPDRPVPGYSGCAWG